jgi:hypothetical protein
LGLLSLLECMVCAWEGVAPDSYVRTEVQQRIMKYNRSFLTDYLNYCDHLQLGLPLFISLLDLSSPSPLHRKTWLKSFVSPPSEHLDAIDQVRVKRAARERCSKLHAHTSHQG